MTFGSNNLTPFPKVPVDCPYCANTYSRRDKLNEHIRKTHPECEVPKAPRTSPPKSEVDITFEMLLQKQLSLCLQFENLHSMVSPAFAAALMTPPNMNGLMGIPIVHHIPGSNGRGKYKEKLFACPHCGKRYCDASRLKNHVDARHMTNDDQWKDVGPGVDIAVKEEHHPSGFQVR